MKAVRENPCRGSVLLDRLLSGQQPIQLPRLGFSFLEVVVDEPNYTQVPNILLDEWMVELTGAELKVLLVICRRLIGWHKKTDRISYSQIIAMTGLQSATVKKSLDSLIESGRVVAEKESGKTTFYELPIPTTSESEEVPLQKVKRTTSKSEETKETRLKKDVNKGINNPLYKSIEQSFLSKNGDQFTNYGREGKAIHGLIEKSTARLPDNPEDFILNMMNSFWKMKCNGDKFWHGQPFLPSTLNANGIWDRVLEKLRTAETTVDPVALAIAKGETV